MYRVFVFWPREERKKENTWLVKIILPCFRSGAEKCTTVGWVCAIREIFNWRVQWGRMKFWLHWIHRKTPILTFYITLQSLSSSQELMALPSRQSSVSVLQQRFEIDGTGNAIFRWSTLPRCSCTSVSAVTHSCPQVSAKGSWAATVISEVESLKNLTRKGRVHCSELVRRTFLPDILHVRSLELMPHPPEITP